MGSDDHNILPLCLDRCVCSAMHIQAEQVDAHVLNAAEYGVFFGQRWPGQLYSQ